MRTIRGTQRGFLTIAISSTLLLASSCSVFHREDGSTTLQHFAEALSREDVSAAAALTNDPEAAATALQHSLDGLRTDPEHGVDITANLDKPEDGPASLHYTWTLPPGHDGKPREFSGTGQANAVQQDSKSEWKVQWQPTVLDTRFGDRDHYSYQPEFDYSPRVLAADGTELMNWIPVTHVQIPRDAAPELADQVAAALGPNYPEITGDSIRKGMAEAKGDRYTTVTLREEALAPLREGLTAIPKVMLIPDHRLVPSGFRSAALSSVQTGLEKKMAERAGWRVNISGPSREEKIAGAPGSAIDDVTTTLDPHIQAAAQSAVDITGNAASLVAIRPSSGEIVAVAQNSSADAYGPVSLAGQFPPGSTFKTVTTAAVLSAGIVGPNSTVNCPAVTSAMGRTIPNDENFALGQVSLGTAFAKSCNTTQSILSEGLSPTAMRDTAASLGLGVDFDIPGLETITGKVPETEPGPARAEAAIGQGTVTASPFGMAVLEASLNNNGEMIAPTFFRGEPAQVPGNHPPLAPEVVSALLDFQRQVVTSGTASGAAGVPGLRGKTGTAETGVGRAHGWFIGSAGDLAFAVLIQEGDSSKPAVSMAQSFLQGV